MHSHMSLAAVAAAAAAAEPQPSAVCAGAAGPPDCHPTATGTVHHFADAAGPAE